MNDIILILYYLFIIYRVRKIEILIDKIEHLLVKKYILSC